jgi:hypothetical protein
MSVRSLSLWLSVSILWSAVATAQIPLAELAKLARQRADRDRPLQQRALEPFWADLSLDYRNNAQFLDTRISEVAALGDSVVPLLLEKLQPQQGGETARHLAGNCRRVLEKLDPASFIDALAELANGTNETGRTEAIRLLGVANEPQAAVLLADLLDRTLGEDKRLVIRSLRLLRAPGPAAKVVTMLASNDQKVREDVLAYLIAAKPAAVADTVLLALSAEREPKLMASYIEYFAQAVQGNDLTARALLPLLERDKLGWQETKRLLQALATVAPRDHEPTIKRLHELIDGGDTSSLGVQAALTLRSLGDQKGVTKLKRSLDEQLRKPARRREAALHEQRGHLLFETEDYGDAYVDYDNMLQCSDGIAMSRRAYIGMMRCEARRKKVQNLTKLMKQSGLTVAELEAIGAEDSVFAETLTQDKVRSFLQALAKEQAPK